MCSERILHMPDSSTPAALITGASRGLGLALARALAARGWRLIITARGAQALEAARAQLAQLTPVTALAGDVATAAHRRALGIAARAAGGLDALVNNASILGPTPLPRLLDMRLEDLRAVLEANTLAPLAVTQVLRYSLKPGSAVVNITSDAAVEGYAGWGGYGASKAALEQISRVLAAEHPEWRVYWVDPGDMNTQMNQEANPGVDVSHLPPPEASVPGLLRLIVPNSQNKLPSGRYTTRELAPEAA
jgi:NAD(P)-dependent dehydrogenase (short-subunit alcohol dehydrogenase family)